MAVDIDNTWLIDNEFSLIDDDFIEYWTRETNELGRHHLEYNSYDNTYTYKDNRNVVYGIKTTYDFDVITSHIIRANKRIKEKNNDN